MTMICCTEFDTKLELVQAMLSGKKLTVRNSKPSSIPPRDNGTILINGPTRNGQRLWYGMVFVKDGVIVDID